MPLYRPLFGTAAAIVLVSQSAAIAQTQVAMPPTETNRSAFTPADFAQFNPQNALDMVRRVPGFTIQSDDRGNPGFGQARGNVLIDAQRVSAKSIGGEAVSLSHGLSVSKSSTARRRILRACPARSTTS